MYDYPLKYRYSNSLLILCLTILIIFSGCKDSVTDPPPDEKPPGYQEDIPWPSLDKNPWPVHQGDAQFTGRSRFSGPVAGVIEWQKEIPDLYEDDSFLSPICSDSVIYFVSYRDTGANSSNLNALGFDGIMKWRFPLKSHKNTTPPVLSSDGTIYIADWDKNLYAIDLEGKLKWTISVAPASITSTMNLDKEGNLYAFLNNGVLYKISSGGVILWTLQLGTFGSSASAIAFAPDGNTLYVTGQNLYAVSITGELKWVHQPYGSGTWSSTPLVDASGNIYLGSGFVKLNSKGEVLPNLNIPDSLSTGDYIDPTIDKNGNIYIGLSEHLVSFDHSGNFRWSRSYDMSYFFSLISDKDGYIYFLTENNNLVCIDQNGTERWQLQLDGRYYYSPAIANGRLYLGLVRGSKRYFCSIK
jgi:outer membrane protein assembly factor BamB